MDTETFEFIAKSLMVSFFVIVIGGLIILLRVKQAVYEKELAEQEAKKAQ